MEQQKSPVYQRLSSLLLQRANCAQSNNTEWFERSTENILALVKDRLPSGSGVDNGTHIDLDKSNGERLVFTTSFHHMDEQGCYAGWTEHTVTVRPSLFDRFTLTISGRDRNQVKDYLHDLFYTALGEEVVH